MRLLHEESLRRLSNPPSELFQDHIWVLRKPCTIKFQKSFGYELYRDSKDNNSTLRRWIVDSLSNEKSNNSTLKELAHQGSDFISDRETILETLYEPKHNVDEISLALRSLIFPKSFIQKKEEDIVYMRDLPKKSHPFQVEMEDKIKSHVLEKKSSILVLPTGTGKTRVALQSILQQMASGKICNTLWLADRIVLLNQTKESAIEIWEDLIHTKDDWKFKQLNIQPKNDLSIINSKSLPTLKFQTVQFYNEKQNLLQNISPNTVIVIDEIHRAERAIETVKEARNNGNVVIGLTASLTEMDNERYTSLVNAFDNNILLPKGIKLGDDSEFEKGKFIARVNKKDVREIIPKDIILDGLDTNDSENHFDLSTNIIKWLEKNDAFPAIWFTNTVEEAQICSAIAESLGIPSTHLSGKTNRRFTSTVLNDFLLGKYKLITNAELLTAGMDIPKIKSVIIDKKIRSSSPAYKQMIGRGRRGPKMGGNDECLVIEVRN